MSDILKKLETFLKTEDDEYQGDYAREIVRLILASDNREFVREVVYRLYCTTPMQLSGKDVVRIINVLRQIILNEPSYSTPTVKPVQQIDVGKSNSLFPDLKNREEINMEKLTSNSTIHASGEPTRMYKSVEESLLSGIKGLLDAPELPREPLLTMEPTVSLERPSEIESLTRKISSMTTLIEDLEVRVNYLTANLNQVMEQHPDISPLPDWNSDGSIIDTCSLGPDKGIPDVSVKEGNFVTLEWLTEQANFGHYPIVVEEGDIFKFYKSVGGMVPGTSTCIDEASLYQIVSLGVLPKNTISIPREQFINAVNAFNKEWMSGNNVSRCILSSLAALGILIKE